MIIEKSGNAFTHAEDGSEEAVTVALFNFLNHGHTAAEQVREMFASFQRQRRDDVLRIARAIGMGEEKAQMASLSEVATFCCVLRDMAAQTIKPKKKAARKRRT